MSFRLLLDILQLSDYLVISDIQGISGNVSLATKHLQLSRNFLLHFFKLGLIEHQTTDGI